MKSTSIEQEVDSIGKDIEVAEKFEEGLDQTVEAKIPVDIIMRVGQKGQKYASVNVLACAHCLSRMSCTFHLLLIGILVTLTLRPCQTTLSTVGLKALKASRVSMDQLVPKDLQAQQGRGGHGARQDRRDRKD